MSSPIVNQKNNKYKKALVDFHKKVSHSTRIKILSNKISELIRIYLPEPEISIKCLDIGTGDMAIAEQIEILDNRISWKCIDIHPLPEELKESEKWKKYQVFDGENIPFADKSFDIAIFSDVLHHSQEKAIILISEAARVSSFIIIKDHFEYSFYSRFILKLMDFVGNWGYGVIIPKRYFTQTSFNEIINKLKIKTLQIDTGINLYEHLPLIKFLLNPKWQFIAVLSSSQMCKESDSG